MTDGAFKEDHTNNLCSRKCEWPVLDTLVRCEIDGTRRVSLPYWKAIIYIYIYIYIFFFASSHTISWTEEKTRHQSGSNHAETIASPSQGTA